MIVCCWDLKKVFNIADLMNTKDKILTSALNLFNDQGAKSVTTNHVAAEAGISPGNLYYHFKNKEEIIRILFQQMVDECNECQDPGRSDHAPSFEGLEEHFETITNIEWKFRFIKRDIASLIEKDRELKKVFLEVHQRKQEEIAESIQGFIDAGLTRDIDDQSKAQMAQIIWLISTFWQPFLELNNKKVTRKALAEGMDLVRFLIKPFIKVEA